MAPQDCFFCAKLPDCLSAYTPICYTRQTSFAFNAFFVPAVSKSYIKLASTCKMLSMHTHLVHFSHTCFWMYVTAQHMGFDVCGRSTRGRRGAYACVCSRAYLRVVWHVRMI